MRPEIARLLTPHIYQDLENHPSVLKYEQIKVSLSYLVISMVSAKIESLRGRKETRARSGLLEALGGGMRRESQSCHFAAV